MIKSIANNIRNKQITSVCMWASLSVLHYSFKFYITDIHTHSHIINIWLYLFRLLCARIVKNVLYESLVCFSFFFFFIFLLFSIVAFKRCVFYFSVYEKWKTLTCVCNAHYADGHNFESTMTTTTTTKDNVFAKRIHVNVYSIPKFVKIAANKLNWTEHQ